MVDNIILMNLSAFVTSWHYIFRHRTWSQYDWIYFD